MAIQVKRQILQTITFPHTHFSEKGEDFLSIRRPTYEQGFSFHQVDRW